MRQSKCRSTKFQPDVEEDGESTRAFLPVSRPIHSGGMNRMPNSDHLRILRERPEDWNKMMATSYSVAADLSNADLSKANLTLIDFQEVDLRGANLEGTDLSFSKFVWTDLSDANLCKANLRGASFGEANLRNADLRYADLSFTVFNDADLHCANLEGAICQQTYFTGVNLSSTRGLDKCEHLGASNLDLLTLAASGTLPDEFLRGCGINSFLLEHLNELKRDPHQFNSCFLSYSHEDIEFARQLYSDLVRRGVRCWFAPENMRAGRKVRGQIDRALGNHDKLLLVLSENSMRSSWVEYEILRARERELRDDRRILFPIAITPFDALRKWQLFCNEEGRDLAREIREYFIPDFTAWRANQRAYRQSLERLLSDLEL